MSNGQTPAGGTQGPVGRQPTVGSGWGHLRFVLGREVPTRIKRDKALLAAIMRDIRRAAN